VDAQYLRVSKVGCNCPSGLNVRAGFLFMKAKYYNCCVTWDAGDVHAEGGLCDMIDRNRTITRQAFCRNVDRDDRAGLTMAGDWAVSYHKSKLHGKTVYYLRHSAIEYVFR
jgi:hypothetical protein